MKKINYLIKVIIPSFGGEISKLLSLSLFFLLFFVTLNSNAVESNTSVQEIYSRVKVKTNPQQFAKMNAEIGFDHLQFQKDGSFIGEFSQTEIAKMTSLGATIKILIADIVKDLIQKNSASRLASTNIANAVLPNGFSYGSMGGYLTFAEMVAKLDLLRTMYPNLITVKQSIGKSTENRDLWMVKISDNPDVDENEPKVHFNALTHAREPMSMTELIYYMCYILQNYNTNPEIKHLIDNREMYFVPCVNPDGYEYNRSTNPSGGGLWRKNRYKETTYTTTYTNCHNVIIGRKCDTTWNRTHTSYTVKNCKNINQQVCDTVKTATTTIYGVDLNRNYSYKWGYDNTGSSATKTSDTYRGPSAFSEPETKAIRDFCVLKSFKEVFNQHTPGNDATYPYSYNNSVVNPEQAFYDLKSNLITEDNHFLIGHMLQTQGYLANGEASDWQFGDQTTKPKAYSWTPELGSSFWPVQADIEPLCLTMIRMNHNLAWMGAEYFRYSAPAGINATSTTLIVPVTTINYGDNAGSIESIKFFANDLTPTGTDSVSMNGIVPGMTAVRNLTLNLSALSGSGTKTGVLRISYSDGYTEDKPFSFTYSLPALQSNNETARNKAPAFISKITYELFPNPVNNILFFTSKDVETPISMSVYNMNGELLKKVSNENQISISDLPAGMYHVMIETANGMLTNKIIKQ